ncbi:cellular tumor antigen p53 isoform X3 [Teleopsis dalmanni]|uniref:cellular tumor antigen p53 isoform X3 n=1 Tax=Teleopsis dalmanni TaxID=139649 RepID=UPI0018CF8D24|nr:cellular tumor antigen p53 isoform X3 [Teleopsis dalmanni]
MSRQNREMIDENQNSVGAENVYRGLAGQFDAEIEFVEMLDNRMYCNIEVPMAELQQQHIQQVQNINQSLLYDFHPQNKIVVASNFIVRSEEYKPAVTDAGNDVQAHSDASTVDEPINEEDVVQDDAYAYLQGLNSENLMQFSQQSALQEIMIKEQLDAKCLNVDVLPTFEDHDIGGYRFHLNLQSTRAMFSEALNKVYLRMNENFSLDVVYTPKLPLQPLRLRVFMCFTKEASKPVLRCHNHMSLEKQLDSQLRNSLLRSENPSATYCGSPEGKSINERFSVLIPLGINGMPREDKSVKQTIELKFTCQNSCIGRKETNIVFLLEAANGEVLAQRVIDVKICTCPKRDMAIDHKNNIDGLKRKNNGVYSYSRSSKMRKLHKSKSVKDENSSDSENDDNDNKRFDIQRTPSGSIRLVMNVSSKEEALHLIDCAYNQAACKMCIEPNKKRYSKNFKALKRLRDKAEKI